MSNYFDFLPDNPSPPADRHKFKEIGLKFDECLRDPRMLKRIETMVLAWGKEVAPAKKTNAKWRKARHKQQEKILQLWRKAQHEHEEQVLQLDSLLNENEPRAGMKWDTFTKLTKVDNGLEPREIGGWFPEGLVGEPPEVPPIPFAYNVGPSLAGKYATLLAVRNVFCDGKRFDPLPDELRGPLRGIEARLRGQLRTADLKRLRRWFQDVKKDLSHCRISASGVNATNSTRPLNATKKKILSLCREKALPATAIARALELSNDHIRRVLAQLMQSRHLKNGPDGYQTLRAT